MAASKSEQAQGAAEDAKGTVKKAGHDVSVALTSQPVSNADDEMQAAASAKQAKADVEKRL